MIIIAESGATKTDWCAVETGQKTLSARTSGINLSTMPEDVIESIVLEAKEALTALDGGMETSGYVSEVCFYAAGLISSGLDEVPPQARYLDKVLKGLFKDAKIEYASDLLDAARAVCGRKPGIAAILGTGSNSCFYDSSAIVKNVRSAGFILGDEGSGARLGKMFLSDYLKGLVPKDVADDFADGFTVDYLTVVRNVYGSGSPSKYLGSFAPWILGRYDSDEYVRSMVDRNFKDFIERCLMQYDYKNYPIGVVGGFGFANRDILRKVAEPYGIGFSKFIASPMEGLVEYHLSGKK